MKDLEETFAVIQSYNRRLNLDKCMFGVQAGKFLGFMLTSRGIEANPDRCQTIIDMRSMTSICEVQQLSGRLAALSRFLSCAREKSIHFFATIKKRQTLNGTKIKKKAFIEVKKFLSTPPILVRPKENTPLVFTWPCQRKPLARS